VLLFSLGNKYISDAAQEVYMASTASELDFGDQSVEDMYLVAVHIEQGGYNFYSQIIERSENPRIKNEVIFLRDEEAKHKAFFQNQLSSRGLAASAELREELKSWLDREFVKPVKQVLNSRDITKNEDALQLGVRLEWKTIELYETLKAQISEMSAREDLQAIIDEEYRHKEKLNLLLAH
jgi:rubrerythrin